LGERISFRLENIIDLKAFNESITVLGGLDIHVTPLGIYYNKGLLKAKIYPGTKLHECHERYYEACIAFPFTPEPYYYSILSKERLRLRSPKSIHTPCIAYPSIVIESVIAARERKGEYIILTFIPVDHYIYGSPLPYRRSLGCSIELLIAFTRIKYWASRKPTDCSIIEKLIRIVEDSFSCILHSTWNEHLHRLAAITAKLAFTHALKAGCTIDKINRK
jgi:hypothetical protein